MSNSRKGLVFRFKKNNKSMWIIQMNWNYFKSCRYYWFTLSEVSYWHLCCHTLDPPLRDLVTIKNLRPMTYGDQLHVKCGWNSWTSYWKNEVVIVTPTSLYVVIKSYDLRTRSYQSPIVFNSICFIYIHADNYAIYSLAYDRTYRIEYTTYYRMVDTTIALCFYNLNDCSV